jgi:hypothetical protein
MITIFHGALGRAEEGGGVGDEKMQQGGAAQIGDAVSGEKAIERRARAPQVRPISTCT